MLLIQPCGQIVDDTTYEDDDVFEIPVVGIDSKRTYAIEKKKHSIHTI